MAAHGDVREQVLAAVDRCWVRPLLHVEHDDGGVVAAARGVREPDEFLGGCLWVREVAERVEDDLVGHLVHEAVAAGQEPVSAHDRQRPHVDTDPGLDAECASDDVALWVHPRLRSGDVSRVDEFLHVRVVDAYLLEPAGAQAVGAGVAHVDDGKAGLSVPLHDGDPGERGSHAPVSGVGAREAEDVEVGGDDSVHCVVRGDVAGQPAEAVRSHGGRNLTSEVTTHAVGNGEHLVRHHERVLVHAAHAPRVRGGSDKEALVGHWASTIVPPICTRSPRWIGLGTRMRSPFR
ncbi:unannotated protein [freshwater metagenome]|uniref:Unannotated protein n=1 Tax=freshwater metagenome TaxID=449393 RepID=A0A6J6SEH2_9ZZZZ